MSHLTDEQLVDVAVEHAADITAMFDAAVMITPIVGWLECRQCGTAVIVQAGIPANYGTTRHYVHHHPEAAPADDAEVTEGGA